MHASEAEPNFDDLSKAGQGSPAARPDVLAERKKARLLQAVVENDRLLRHQAVASKLLSSSDQEAMNLVGKARLIVRRWENAEPPLCSRHYIELWDDILDMPIIDLAHSMCSDFKGWGNALRQNSPWNVISF